jgi:integrase
MRGLRREKAEVTQKKEALRLSDLARGLPPNSSKERDLRDRALLLLGFFSALRRSELVGLDVHDIRTIPTGLRLTIRRSKTDKNTEGQTVIVPLLTEHITLCPVTAVNMWLQHRGQEPGPLFWSLRSKLRLSPQEIARIVKKAARQAGYDPRDFGAHSLRAGFATSAAEVEAEERDIMRVTRHRSERTVREYIREGQAGSSHPGFKIAAAVAEGKT